ncbi:MAG TPA: histone-like nucleoid-structuring protein Lsr2 [Nocardioidaceae bacterium]|nr:histone-like nucleoid-structuring protein Lsr2 [Nocardioidaceae bacterium]
MSSTDSDEQNGPQDGSGDRHLSSARRPGRKSRPVKGASAARRKSSAGGKRTTRVRVSTAELRSWARENGYAVAERGRIPAEIAAAYDATEKG